MCFFRGMVIPREKYGSPYNWVFPEPYYWVDGALHLWYVNNRSWSTLALYTRSVGLFCLMKSSCTDRLTRMIPLFFHGMDEIPTIDDWYRTPNNNVLMDACVISNHFRNRDIQLIANHFNSRMFRVPGLLYNFVYHFTVWWDWDTSHKFLAKQRLQKVMEIETSISVDLGQPIGKKGHRFRCPCVSVRWSFRRTK